MRRDLVSRVRQSVLISLWGWEMIIHETTNSVARKTSLVMAFFLLPLSMLTMHFYYKPSRITRFLFPPPTSNDLAKRIKALKS